MQMLIEIPEEEYRWITKSDETVFADVSSKECMLHAIKNGVPLPKGHGRIADMDAAIKCIKEVKGEDAIWAISLIEWACGKRTIIEADALKKREGTPLEENDSGYNCENWIP